ncbi:toxin-antitoxin system [Herbiconiux sp.]|uniref:FitA-like ribbon-helix-helix domain-containing protein n=1 Tax=Herbiconiux sp. TaxID=1871186 RepID=UPI0025C23B70|nr:toxin-antitoxin system [Herbiconiux sp.]
MATITVRDLDETTRAKLRIRAARNGRSMEAEVRAILDSAVADQPTKWEPLGTRIRALVAERGGADDLIPHLPIRENDGSHRIPDFTHPKYGIDE